MSAHSKNDYRHKALSTFAADQKGQLSIVVALSALPALTLIGAGIDYARMTTARASLQSQVDSAVLGAQLQNIKSNSALNTYVASQITSPDVTVTSATYSSTDSKMCATVSQSVSTTMMKIVRINTMTTSATACSLNAESAAGTFEIALGLDNTGSMAVSDKNGVSKLASEQAAAKAFISKVFSTIGTTNATISVVPFTTAVKVGASYKTAAWMDTAGKSSIHWENFPKQNTTAEQAWAPKSRFDLYDQINQSWGGCVEERPQPYTFTDTAADPATPDTLYVPMFAPDESDSPKSGYKSYNSYLSDNGGICASGDAYATADKNGTYGDGASFFGDGQNKLCKYAVKWAANNPSATQTASDVQSAIQDYMASSYSNSTHDSNNWTLSSSTSTTYCGWYSGESYCRLSAADAAAYIVNNNLYSVASDNSSVNFCTKFTLSTSNRGVVSIDTSNCYSTQYSWQNYRYTATSVASFDKSTNLPANYVNNPQGTAAVSSTANYSSISTSNWTGSGWNYGGNGWGAGSGWGWGGSVNNTTYSAGFNASTSNPGYTSSGASSSKYIGANQFNLGGGANSGCDSTLQPLQTLTNSQTTLNTLIDKMQADGATNIVSGLLWAWRTISPNGPFTAGGAPRAYNASNNRKVIVFMTDGYNNWETDDSQNGGVYSAFGYYHNNRAGALTVNGSSQTPTASNNRDYLDAAFLQACTNAKNAGVEVYTVAFSVDRAPIDTKGQNVLRSCASDAGHFKVATTGDELTTFFNSVGTALTQKSIRLTN